MHFAPCALDCALTHAKPDNAIRGNVSWVKINRRRARHPVASNASKQNTQERTPQNTPLNNTNLHSARHELNASCSLAAQASAGLAATHVCRMHSKTIKKSIMNDTKPTDSMFLRMLEIVGFFYIFPSGQTQSVSAARIFSTISMTTAYFLSSRENGLHTSR